MNEEESGADYMPTRTPRLNRLTTLLYSGDDWCVLADQDGKAYCVSFEHGVLDVQPL